MNDFIILGTDTDVGKTSFSLLWLTVYADRFDYWKPVQTGPPDSQKVADFVPSVTIHPSLATLDEPVAPPLAAKHANRTIPNAADIAQAKPSASTGRGLLIETFGGPFSPLTDDQLQIDLVEMLNLPSVLVSSSLLGAVGRTIQCLDALRQRDIRPHVVLFGPFDPFAEEQIRRHGTAQIVSVPSPTEWTVDGIKNASELAADACSKLLSWLTAQQPGSAEKTVDVSLVERDAKSVWHPYTPLLGAADPLPCVGSQDEFLWLADGRRVIDGISSWWTIQHGHRYPPLMKVLHEAAQAFDHVHFAGITHAPAVELAEALLQTAPWNGGGRVFYSDNGSTAVEVALKMAYQYWCHRDEPQRTRFVGFEGGYHGDTFGAMSVGRDPLFFGRFEPLLFQADVLPVDPNRLDSFLADQHDKISAVILEPLVQGAGGMLMHTPQTLRDIAEVTRKHGLLFIADEVMTGGGRTGTVWAHQAASIAPDLICSGKTLAGGILPIAATLAAPHVVDAFATDDRSRTFFHGHSFTAHPLACAVGAVNWRNLAQDPSPVPVKMQQIWESALMHLRERKNIRDVRTCGIIAAIELDVGGGYLADIGHLMREETLKHGVLLRPLGNVLYTMPPFCTSDASLRQIAYAMEKAIERVS